MAKPPPIITILTDFGEADGFVGTMKGVMLGIAPDAQLVDLTHLIAPQDVKQAAFVLLTSMPFFPEGTVHLIVVDPGVGSARRPIAVETPTARYVAPDNGVLSYVLARETPFVAHELASPAYRLPEVSHTFHGRDVFSPAAAHLAAGVPIQKLGPQLADIVWLDMPRLDVGEKRIEGQVLKIDHFGNIRTSVHKLTWSEEDTLELRPLFGPSAQKGTVVQFPAGNTRVTVGSLTIDGISRTFSDVAIGQPVAFVGSENSLEIGVNQGDAASAFGVGEGDLVTLHLRT